MKNTIKKIVEETEKMNRYENLQVAKNLIEENMKIMDAMDEKAAFKIQQNKIQH